MSSSSATSRRRLPTHCKCGFPLVKRVSWTDLNPARRFLNCRNSNVISLNFRSYDCLLIWCFNFLPFLFKLLGGRTVMPSGGLILSPWYKYQMFELYVTQHHDQRFLFVEHLRAQDQLERLQVEHDGLVSKFKQSI
ncbi:hypothetical protein Tco_1511485 [Tanacetum coccineum]